MSDFDLILFDDGVAREWEPFATTRPCGELLFGTMTLRQRAERALGSRCVGHLSSPHLQGFDEAGAPPVVAAGIAIQGVPTLFLLSRFVVDLESARDWRPERPGRVVDGEGSTVGYYVDVRSELPSEESLLRLDGEGPTAGAPLPGTALGRVWNLISLNPERVERDIVVLHAGAGRPALPTGVHQWGEHPLVVDPSAVVEPGCALDTSAGPIWLDRNSRVRAFTRLVGPAYVGPDSVVLGGPVEAVSIGPVCRVRGELAESVCLGYMNKQHDGHIGHAYLGRWVNLGAETTNSDLKNNYGTIRMWTPSGSVDTGEIKMGSLVGDHVKTGIGLLLNTGSVIGAGSNLYGASLPPVFVPPFSWGSGEQLTEYRLDKFLEVTEQAMKRRGVTLSDSTREQLGRAWTHGRGLAGT